MLGRILNTRTAQSRQHNRHETIRRQHAGHVARLLCPCRAIYHTAKSLCLQLKSFVSLSQLLLCKMSLVRVYTAGTPTKAAEALFDELDKALKTEGEELVAKTKASRTQQLRPAGTGRSSQYSMIGGASRPKSSTGTTNAMYVHCAGPRSVQH